MAKSKLITVSYTDKKEGICLTNYADTVAYRDSPNHVKTLAAIRFGGYPEQVRGMSDAIYGGGSIEVRDRATTLRLDSLTNTNH